MTKPEQRRRAMVLRALQYFEEAGDLDVLTAVVGCDEETAIAVMRVTRFLRWLPWAFRRVETDSTLMSDIERERRQWSWLRATWRALNEEPTP